jgi:hypothetical protein
MSIATTSEQRAEQTGFAKGFKLREGEVAKLKLELAESKQREANALLEAQRGGQEYAVLSAERDQLTAQLEIAQKALEQYSLDHERSCPRTFGRCCDCAARAAIDAILNLSDLLRSCQRDRQQLCDRLDAALAEVDRKDEALKLLAGCMPNVVYVFGTCGERWADTDPGIDPEKYKIVNFQELLAEVPK